MMYNNNMKKVQGKPQKVKRVKRTQPKTHTVKILRTDGSYVFVKSIENKDITLQTYFDKHSAYLPPKEVAKLIQTSNITEGLL